MIDLSLSAMAPPLPRLRSDLDFMPSPLREQPGLLVRDPFRYSTTTLVIPPLLARCLGCFDGEQDEGDLRATLARLSGQVDVGEAVRHLVTALHDAGFLHDDRYAELREAKERDFAALPARSPAHAGNGYPSDAPALAAWSRGFFHGEAAPAALAGANGGVLGVAAPHVSPDGGRASYAAAYRAIPPSHAERVFVVLGTSHYGEPDRFGLTRKPFVTPFGEARTETALVDELAQAAPGAVAIEDYCHAVEHSVEFQIVFLQHLFGPQVRILPILCGAFIEGPRVGRPPETNDGVARFVGALGELAARERGRLSFVLGVDFAHIGRRYGDPRAARAHEGALVEVAARDRARLSRIEAGDGAGFWDLVMERGEDDLRWCGSSPLFTFLRAVPDARGRALAYEHWNIDEASVVSFGAVAFS